MKRQSTVWEKMFENYIPDKGLISRLHKEFNSNESINSLVLKWLIDLNIYFSNEYI